MDDEIKVVVEVPPTGGVSAPEPAKEISDAVQGALQVAAVADAMSQPAPELAEILRMQGDLIGEVRSLRERVEQLGSAALSATAVSAEIVADAVEELAEEVEDVADDALAATIDIPLETIPNTATTVEVAEIVPEVRTQKKSRKWI